MAAALLFRPANFFAGRLQANKNSGLHVPAPSVRPPTLASEILNRAGWLRWLRWLVGEGEQGRKKKRVVFRM